MFVVNHRTFFFGLVGGIFALSIVAIAALGLPRSIDFTGGSLIEVVYTDARPDLAATRDRVSGVAIGDVSIRESGANGFIVRTPLLTPEAHTAVLDALSDHGASVLTESRFNSIGPSLGSELAAKSFWAIGAVILTIVLYIAWAFRKVSRPVSSWVYGIAVILILIHDVIVPAGFYAVLAHYSSAQVDALFVVGLLAILGYSVNDTIVIFDRVREHLRTNEEKRITEAFETTVGKSITETLTRSINTSVTTSLSLIALALFGSEVTVHFALLLLAGVIAGTYSSILVAATLLIPLARWFNSKNLKA